MAIASQVVTVAEGSGGAITVTAAPATLTDVFSTLLTTNQSLTGLYGLGQKLALVGVGMVTQNARLGRGFNPFRD